MYNLKKYFGILDYALRVISKGFPIYEILLNISTLSRLFFSFFLQNCGQRSSLYEAHTELIKANKSAKNKRTWLPFFENFL